MSYKEINGLDFKNLISYGAVELKKNYQTVNNLNVFPVPDGDTGTNMKMTLDGGLNEILNDENENIYEVSKKLARGMLLGARGNSGVILSQIFKGLSNGLNGFDKVNANQLSYAFQEGVKQGYKAVVKPVEGTILTVVREATEYASDRVNENSYIEDFLQCFIEEADISLKHTPELLPVLKKAGVIDSGGAGLLYIAKGMLNYLTGGVEEIAASENFSNESQKNISRGNFNADSELDFGYCTEFILQLQNKKTDIKNFDINALISSLEALGNSIVAVKDEDLIKVHVHTFTPGDVFNLAQRYGEFVSLKVENMSIQHSETEFERQNTQEKEHKVIAVVAVAGSEGISDTYKGLGADCIVEGDQTMNPSAEDFLKAFNTLDAENIIVLPNNGNIIMTALQAKDMYDKANVVVLASKSLSQGYSALSMYNPEEKLNSVVEDMTAAINNVVSVQITYAVRDAECDGVSIKKDDNIAIVDGKIVCSDNDRIKTFSEMINKIENIEDKEVITLFYGKQITENELNTILKFLSDNYPHIEVGTINGKQEIYSYILAIE